MSTKATTVAAQATPRREDNNNSNKKDNDDIFDSRRKPKSNEINPNHSSMAKKPKPKPKPKPIRSPATKRCQARAKVKADAEAVAKHLNLCLKLWSNFFLAHSKNKPAKSTWKTTQQQLKATSRFKIELVPQCGMFGRSSLSIWVNCRVISAQLNKTETRQNTWTKFEYIFKYFFDNIFTLFFTLHFQWVKATIYGNYFWIFIWQFSILFHF